MSQRWHLGLTLKRGWGPIWPTVNLIGLLVTCLHRIRGECELRRCRHYMCATWRIFGIIFGAVWRCRGRDMWALLCISTYSLCLRRRRPSCRDGTRGDVAYYHEAVGDRLDRSGSLGGHARVGAESRGHSPAFASPPSPLLVAGLGFL